MSAGVQVSHEAVTRALSERYARALAALHEECAQLSAAVDTVIAERDEYARQLNEMSGRLNRYGQDEPTADADSLY